MNESCIVGTRLHTKRLDGGLRELLKPLQVRICGYEIRIKKGFKTDFSSIPTWLHGIVRWSKVDVAGVIHDVLFNPAEHGSMFDEADENHERDLIGRISLRTADRIWREVALRGTGKNRANWVQAALCWFGLFGFSWWTWNRYCHLDGRRLSAARGVGQASIVIVVTGVALHVVVWLACGVGKCLLGVLTRC